VPKTYYFSTKKMAAKHAGGDYSTAHGPFVVGERIIFGHITITRGTQAELHSHPNEQFMLIEKGRARMEVGGQKKTVGPGDMILIPANTLHSCKVTGNQDLVFTTAKDTSWSIHGVKAAQKAPAGPKKAAPRKKAPAGRKAAR